MVVNPSNHGCTSCMVCLVKTFICRRGPRLRRSVLILVNYQIQKGRLGAVSTGILRYKADKPGLFETSSTPFYGFHWPYI
jgi:hypothetical protein